MKTFGKNPSGDRLARIQQSPNYKKAGFTNLELTPTLQEGVSTVKVLKEFMHKPELVVPKGPLPVLHTDLKHLQAAAPSVVWFGHSSYFLQSGNFKILVDPVFSGYASPVPIFGKSFIGSEAYKPVDFPELDLLVLTHDHYDHLDYKTLLQFKDKVKHIVTSLGVGAHLEYWGFPPAQITELDWWQSAEINPEVTLTATPARHFSGRGVVRAKTLWSSFVLDIHGYRIFLGGDSGYGKHFKEIGKQFGSFDLALLECGQYNPYWPYIHMQPEEVPQAARDLNAAMLMPVHWAKFVLAYHEWNDPVKRVVAAAANMEQAISTPMIGGVYAIGQPAISEAWWEL